MNNLDQNYYSHWLDTNQLLEDSKLKTIEISDIQNLDTVGIPVGSISDKIIVDRTLDNTIVIGSSGSGKTQCVILPMIYQSLKSGESVIVTDKNSEIYNLTSGSFVEAGFNVIKIDLSSPLYSDSWNPFTLIKKIYDEGKRDEASSLIECIVNCLIRSETKNIDPYWENTSSQYLTGIILSLLDKGIDADKINFKTLSKFTNSYNEELTIAYIDTIDKNTICYQNIAATHLAPPETKASIMSVLNQKMTILNNNETLVSKLCNSDFDITKIRDSKTIVYFNMDNTLENQSALFNIFFEQINYVLNNDRAKKPINIILDSFDDNIKPIKNLNSKLDKLRARYARIVLFIKGFDKLASTYGKNNIEELKFECSKILYLLSNEYNTLKFISDFCGKKNSTDNLVSPEALRRMPMWSSLLIKSRLMPYYNKLVPFYTTRLEFKSGEAILKQPKEIKVLDLESI